MHPSQQEEAGSCRSSIISQNRVLQEEAHFERSTEDVSGRKDIKDQSFVFISESKDTDKNLQEENTIRNIPEGKASHYILLRVLIQPFMTKELGCFSNTWR